MSFLQDVEHAIAKATGEVVVLDGGVSVGGGCINETRVIASGSTHFFLKSNTAALGEMFEAESEGLRELSSAGAIRVPEVICSGRSGDRSFLVLEHLPLHGTLDGSLFGQQLAQLHQHTQATFGWYRDNYIGATPQRNSHRPDWVSFLRENRLSYQLVQARAAGLAHSAVMAVEQLMERLPDFFSGYAPRSSLLHGDLWSGNWAATSAGEPVIFDPAVYYGDHEADLAMMELFGAPGGRFFAAYREAFPIDAGYATRKNLYNLYHILNHFNLFGGGYGQQAGRMAERLLSEVG